MVKLTGLPIAEGIKSAADLPHTLSTAIQYRARINSFQEIQKDKQPPRNLWDKPFQLKAFFEDVFETNKTAPKSRNYLEYDLEDVE